MKVEYAPINEIKPYENNPRLNDQAVDAVAASIKAFGWRQPIVVDKNGVIVAGHTRYKAAVKMGLDKVPVERADDLTEEQVKAYRLADNKTAELAGWDFSKLEEELDNIELDMTEFGFLPPPDLSALDDFFAPAPEEEKEEKKIQCPHCGEWFTP